jgi:hypothetical protein
LSRRKASSTVLRCSLVVCNLEYILTSDILGLCSLFIASIMELGNFLLLYGVYSGHEVSALDRRNAKGGFRQSERTHTATPTPPPSPLSRHDKRWRPQFQVGSRSLHGRALAGQVPESHRSWREPWVSYPYISPPPWPSPLLLFVVPASPRVQID